MLISGAEAIDTALRMRGRGVTSELAISWPELSVFKRTFTDPVPANHERRYAELGIDAFHGMARFTGRDTIEVGGHTIQARHVLIATGARPAPLTFRGAGQVITSDLFVELERLPARIVMVGGGYIAAEFSHIAARAGAKVTVLQRAERMLPRFEPELVGWLMEKYAEIEEVDSGFRVRGRAGSEETAVDADLVVHAAGRVPDLDLNLSAAGIAAENGRLALNEFLQSVSNPVVYAAGDAAAKGPPLTPVSSHDGKVVAGNLLEGNRHRPDYRGVPSVAFTLPPIAAVGMSELAARASGLAFRVNCQKVSDWYTARRVGETVYGYKTLIEEGSGRVLRAHLVGPHVDEVINLFALAIRRDLTAEDLRQTIFAYPTSASDIGSML
jgi:glutathione reductase (NADPH)